MHNMVGNIGNLSSKTPMAEIIIKNPARISIKARYEYWANGRPKNTNRTNQKEACLDFVIALVR